MPSSYKPKHAIPDQTNCNNQLAVEEDSTYLPNQQFSKPWRLRCLEPNCGHEYGANNFDIYNRKCPRCQGGTEGLAEA